MDYKPPRNVICAATFSSEDEAKIHIGRHLTRAAPALAARSPSHAQAVAQSCRSAVAAGASEGKGGEEGDGGGARCEDGGGGGSFPCHRCGYAARSRAELARHAWQHTRKTFQCRECGLAFSHPDTLRLHMRAHSAAAAFPGKKKGKKKKKSKGLKQKKLVLVQ